MADATGYEFGTAAAHGVVLALIVVVGLVGYVLPVSYFVNAMAPQHDIPLRLLTGVLSAIPGLGIGAMIVAHLTGGAKPVAFQSLIPLVRSLTGFPLGHLFGDASVPLSEAPLTPAETLFAAAREIGAESGGTVWAGKVAALEPQGRQVFAQA